MTHARMPLAHGAARQHPRAIIVHCMGEYIDTDLEDYHAVAWLAHLGLSAHAFVTPTGVLIRSRADEQGAYHAKGRNTDTLGVEFLVPGLHTYETFRQAIATPYLTPGQYATGLALVREWIRVWGIDELVRHSDVSPGRKHDPGTGFPWDRFVREARA